MEVPPVVIRLRLAVSMKNIIYFGGTPMETPQYSRCILYIIYSKRQNEKIERLPATILVGIHFSIFGGVFC